MKKHFFASFFFLMFLSLLLISCAPRLSIVINEEETGSLSFQTETDSVVETPVRSILNLPEDVPLFDADAVTSSLISSGIQITQLKIPGLAGLQFDAVISDISNAFPQVSGAFSYKKESTKQSLTFTISPEILQSAVSFMPPETAEYIELLMAPVFTGEALTKEEYEELIDIVYGNTCGSAMKNSSMKISITTPTKVRETSISDTSMGSASYKDNQALFSIPFSVLLTKTEPTSFTIIW